MEDFYYQSTRSGALIGSNDDLITEILLRLPLTSILRFKSVSKRWRWLLSQRWFTIRYDSLSKSPGLFARNIYIPFDVENRSTPPFRSLDFYYDPRGIEILQSCNGLLLCCSDRGTKHARKYYVFNPTTKQFAIIPSVPGGKDIGETETNLFMALAFHQTDCVHYKVVCVRKMDPDGELFQIQIYSSHTKTWRISIESFSAHKPNFYKGVYWNGGIHWHPSLRSHFYFKLEVEQLQTMPLPLQMASSGSYYDKEIPLYFGESRGHLHLVGNYRGVMDYLRPNVYEMPSDHSGWFIKYQVMLDQLPSAFPEMRYPTGYTFSVIDVVRGEKEEDTFIVMTVPGKFIRYNVHDKCFKNIFNFTSKLYGGYWRVHRYTEALTYF